MSPVGYANQGHFGALRETEVGDPLRSKGGGTGNGGETVVASFWNGEQVTQTLDAVLQKGQTMPEKNRFPAVLVPPTAFYPTNRQPEFGKDRKSVV